MGLDLASVQLLCCAKNVGVDFTDTLMIGRQEVLCASEEIRGALSTAAIAEYMDENLCRGQFGERLYRLLGAENVYSLDGSDYEDASFVSDLNAPCPDSLKNRFSLVHDGGTLEHVFNISQAYKNCMEMVRVGGSFIQITAANNFMGHGFWQISPETIFRIFSQENGFIIKAVLLRVVAKNGKWYQVLDPAQIGWRAELINSQRTYICTIAQRVEEVSVLKSYPYQSDYTRAWERAKSDQPVRVRGAPKRFFLHRAIPRTVRKALRMTLDSFKGNPLGFDQPYYKYISDDDLMRGRFGTCL
jgi:hypothetical protein